MISLVKVTVRLNQIQRGIARAKAAGCVGAVARLEREREQISRILCNATRSAHDEGCEACEA